jgi:hypothetical protein
MSYRETNTRYHSGVQQEHKLQLITFLGWTMGRQRKYDENKLIETLSPTELPKGKFAVLWYTMYGQTTPLPLPFDREQKKVFQVKHFAPLHKLKQRHHYAVWCLNAKDESLNAGEWFWQHFLEVNQTQAKELLIMKKRHHDIDYPHPVKRVKMVTEIGYPEGAHIYDYARDFFGTDDLEDYQWKMVMEAYYKDLDTAKARKFNEELAKERLYNTLFETD